MFKFIHAADTHIDSRLLGLAAYPGAPVEKLRAATQDAFANLVTLAIDEQVAFIIIAGDLFDGEWGDVRTGLWTAGQYRRLARQSIPIFLVRGNHDAASKVRTCIDWPKTDRGDEIVKEFSVRHPETFQLEDLGVALHGRGFKDQNAPQDLTVDYPDPIDGFFNIGVLHTSLSGDSNHATYAPVSEQALVNKGYDYWALGHVHQSRTVCQEPRIEFPGNTQGRHVKETGAKGCLLVTVDDRAIEQVEFRPTDVLRWHRAEVVLAQDDDLPKLYELVRKQLGDCHAADDGRFTAVRLTIRGACRAHDRLVRKGDRDEAIAQIRNIANDIDEVWVEKIELETSPPVDLEQLRKGSDLLGDLLRHSDQTAQDDRQRTELTRVFQPLADKAARELEECEIRLDDPDQIRRWLSQAEALLVALLTEVTS